jgi:hypothetical protein
MHTTIRSLKLVAGSWTVVVGWAIFLAIGWLDEAFRVGPPASSRRCAASENNNS